MILNGRVWGFGPRRHQDTKKNFVSWCLCGSLRSVSPEPHCLIYLGFLWCKTFSTVIAETAGTGLGTGWHFPCSSRWAGRVEFFQRDTHSGTDSSCVWHGHSKCVSNFRADAYD